MSMYEEMKAKGIDMSWYEKGKKGRAGTEAPLEDEECYPGSIYYTKDDGSLWTIDAHGAPYKQIRAAGELSEATTYLCAHCDGRWQKVTNKENLVIHP